MIQYNLILYKKGAINLKIGYARVSRDSQSLERQLDIIKSVGVDKIFTEKITGTKSNRPELNKLRLRARDGDIIVIESLSRLGRSTKDLLTLINDFSEKGIKLVSLKENIDTYSATGKLITTLLSAICEFERDTIVQRTTEGLASARARGRIGGRPKTDAKKVDKAIKLYNAQVHSVKEITAITGVSQATLYRYLKDESNFKSY